MQALPIQQHLLEVLKGSKKMDVALTEKEKITMIEKICTYIILSLNDKVLWHVSKEKTVAGVWPKHEGLHMAKSLVNRI